MDDLEKENEGLGGLTEQQKQFVQFAKDMSSSHGITQTLVMDAELKKNSDQTMIMAHLRAASCLAKINQWPDDAFLNLFIMIHQNSTVEKIPEKKDAN